MKPVALLLCLTLCACSSPRTQIGTGSIPVRYVDSLPNSALASWDRDNRVIYVTGRAGPAWLAHESLHAVDSIGGVSLSQVLDMVGELPGYEHDVALARRVAAEGGDWYALYRICGPHAVRHPEILAGIKLRKALGK